MTRKTTLMSAPNLYVAEITPDEILAGFSVRKLLNPDGPQAAVLSVTHTWGDPSHRLVKTRGRDGRIIFQLQAFGRPRSRVGPPEWYAERHWPERYGPAWVIDRLREHVNRPNYKALIDLHIPSGDESWPVVQGSSTMEFGLIAVAG